MSRFVPFCPIFAFAPGLVPEAEGVLSFGQGRHKGLPLRLRRLGQGRHIGLPLRLRRLGQGRHKGLPLRLRRLGQGRHIGLPLRLTPVGQGRHKGLPLRWGVLTSVSFFLVCILMVGMGYAGWQGVRVSDSRPGMCRCAWYYGPEPRLTQVVRTICGRRN